MSPEVEKFSWAMSMSTTVSCPKASWDTQARKCRTMNSYRRPSFPWTQKKQKWDILVNYSSVIILLREINKTFEGLWLGLFGCRTTCHHWTSVFWCDCLLRSKPWTRIFQHCLFEKRRHRQKSACGSRLENICTNWAAGFSDVPAGYWSAWWGGWGGGPGQISCPVVGWDPRAGQSPSGRTSPRPGFVSAAPPADREPTLWGKCWSPCVGSWCTWAEAHSQVIFTPTQEGVAQWTLVNTWWIPLHQVVSFCVLKWAELWSGLPTSWTKRHLPVSQTPQSLKNGNSSKEWTDIWRWALTEAVAVWPYITQHALTPGYRVSLQFSWSLWRLFLVSEMQVSLIPVGG